MEWRRSGMDRRVRGAGRRAACAAVAVLAMGWAPVAGGEDEGGAERVTREQGIERLLRMDLDLRALREEISGARAAVIADAPSDDSLTLIVGGDGLALVRVRVRAQDGPPMRWARLLAGHLAGREAEARYYDAVRVKVGRLDRATLDVQGAREGARFQKAFIEGIGKLIELQRIRVKNGLADESSVEPMELQRQVATLALEVAESAVGGARLELADLLALPRADVEPFVPDPILRNKDRAIPAVEELIHIAQERRHEPRASKLGLCRAWADWLSACVEGWPELQVVVIRKGASTARRPGILVRWPDPDRTRQRLLAAQAKARRAQDELARAEHRITWEVRHAALEHERSRSMAARLEMGVTAARRARDDAFQRFRNGQSDISTYILSQKDYNDTVSLFRGALIRLLRSRHGLNAAVGRQLIP